MARLEGRAMALVLILEGARKSGAGAAARSAAPGPAPECGGPGEAAEASRERTVLAEERT